MARFATVLFVILAGSAHGGSLLWLHHSASPVAVPGGSTSFFIDDQPPPDLQPVVVEEITVADGATVAFPTFVSVPFAADTVLDPFVAVNVELSANQEMTECATFSQTVARIGTGGMATTLGARSFADMTIPMSTDSGVTGFTDAGLLMAVTDGAMIQTGEGIAVTVKITNKCGANRKVWLAYDSLDAAAYLQSVPVSVVEFKCQAKTAMNAAKFLAMKARCLSGCQSGVRAGTEPATDCVPPYGGATATCIGKIEQATIAREEACLDCPQCYAGGDCTADAVSRVATMESIVDALQPQIFCDDSGSPDGLTDLEAGCQQRIALSLSKLFIGELKCLTACRKREFKSRVPAGSCTPPASDERTIECLQKVEGVAASQIDRVCTVDAPECDTNDGAAWTSMLAAGAQSLDGGLFCGSPSGAFVD